MMKGENRLRKTSDFKKAYREGRKFLGAHFVLYARKNNSPETRFGISISKCHFKLATRRNKLRRIAKETFRNEIKPRFKGYDFVLSSRNRCGSSDVDKAATDLRELMIGLEG